MNLNLDSAVQYHYGHFPPADLPYDNKLINVLLKANTALARYDQMLKNMHNSEILLAPLRNQEAVISSRMEGTISTMDEILRYEADHGEHADAVTRQDVIETYLYQRTLKRMQEVMESGYPLSSALIKQAHQGLLALGRGQHKSPGQFKTEQNYLADRYKKNILFVPISPDQLSAGVDTLFKYINQSDDPELIRTAIAHVEFEALHPFKDGNGRIGRMLITLMLWNYGLISSPHFYISGYMEEHKDEYIDVMRKVSSEQSWVEWCIFFLNATAVQAERNLSIAEDIRQLYEEMKLIFADVLSSKWSMQILDFVFANPFFRNNTLMQKLGIPSATVYKAIHALVAQNLLREVEAASGRRAAMYSFEPLLNKVRV